NPTTPSHGPALRSVHAAAEALGVRLHEAPTQRIEDYDKAVSILIGENVNSFLVLASPIGYSDNAAPLIRLALTHRLAGMFGYKEDGGGGGPVVLSHSRALFLSSSRVLHGKNPKGQKTGGPAGGAGLKVRTDDQRQDCPRTRPHDPADGARARRRCDRMK